MDKHVDEKVNEQKNPCNLNGMHQSKSIVLDIINYV